MKKSVPALLSTAMAVLLTAMCSGVSVSRAANQFNIPGTSGMPGLSLPSGIPSAPEQHQMVQGLQPQRPDGRDLSPPVRHKNIPSPFEDYIQGKIPDLVSTSVEQFGYNLFEEPPSTFAPVDTVPVSPDYLVGPGDEIRINIWGKLNADLTAEIDNDGKINVPQLGIIYLTGLTFAEAKETIEKTFGRYYRPEEVKINVSLGRLRTITVFIVGKAQTPGSYSLSSLSTLVNALFAAGGPAKNGTMRDIQVKRNGVTVTNFDFYDFLLKGDKTKDIRLLPEDVIFIPPAGPQTAVTGYVNTPAIYELKGEKTVKEVIELAGGLNDIAFQGRLQIERIMDNRYGTVYDANIEDIKTADVSVQGGDLIKVFPVVQDKKVVRLVGAVQREGQYGVGQGLTVKDLIAMAGGLRYFAFTDEAEITRVVVTQKGPETTKLPINLRKAMDGDPRHNLPLQENDYLIVKSVPEWELYRTVTIEGEVRFPGMYTIRKGETLSSLLKRAGGYTDKAYLKGTIFNRESVRELQQRQNEESVDRLERQMMIQSAGTIEAALTPEDASQQKLVFEQRMALLEKLRSAQARGRLSIRLDPIDRFEGSPYDIALENKDRIVIPEKPQQVQVIGSVYNQTAFVYDPQGTVSTYISKAGGMTRDADKKEMYVLKVDGSAVSKRASGGVFGSWGELDPGDTIVVPEKIEKIAWLKEVKDITQILYQIAVTAGVLIVAF
ncbi:MAG: SLBB domain-containing protein [Nitrospirae bacterium]|nr:SLBB domain-containing protein [Nitrospirota bacterium]